MPMEIIIPRIRLRRGISMECLWQHWWARGHDSLVNLGQPGMKIYPENVVMIGQRDLDRRNKSGLENQVSLFLPCGILKTLPMMFLRGVDLTGGDC